MRGGIQKKGNRWYAVVYDGVDPGTGKKRRRWVPAGTRRSDAERVLSDLIRRKYDGEPAPTEKLTVGEYLTKRWLPIQKSKVRASTYDSYRRNIDLHVLPALGRRSLDKLTVEDVDLFYATLLTEGRKNKRREGTPLAPKTVRNIHLMLNKAMADAQRKGLVVRNVVALADAPSQTSRPKGATRPGTRRSCGCSLTRSEPTVSIPRSTCRPTQACGAAKCSVCAGATSISTPAACRSARPWCRSPTRCSSPT
jgi:hypothetical protein